MKNYKGKLERTNEKTIENYIYADEKEWRYVPHPFVGDLWPSLNLERAVEPNQKAVLSKKFLNLALVFLSMILNIGFLFLMIATRFQFDKLPYEYKKFSRSYIISKVLNEDKVKTGFLTLLRNSINKQEISFIEDSFT